MWEKRGREKRGVSGVRVHRSDERLGSLVLLFLLFSLRCTLPISLSLCLSLTLCHASAYPYTMPVSTCISYIHTSIHIIHPCIHASMGIHLPLPTRTFRERHQPLRPITPHPRIRRLKPLQRPEQRVRRALTEPHHIRQQRGRQQHRIDRKFSREDRQDVRCAGFDLDTVVVVLSEQGKVLVDLLDNAEVQGAPAEEERLGEEGVVVGGGGLRGLGWVGGWVGREKGVVVGG
jgi:hypothetical protein